jgi:hypothetical protein
LFHLFTSSDAESKLESLFMGETDP